MDPPSLVIGNFTTPESGLLIQGSNCSIFGLEITSFPDNGILLDGPANTIIGKPDGFNVITSHGVSFDDTQTPNNYIIGAGIRLIDGAVHSTINYNYIGTNKNQEALGNEYCGIYIQPSCDNNTIGGNQVGSGNYIANNANGIRVEPGSDFNEFVRNRFSCNDSIAIKNIAPSHSRSCCSRKSGRCVHQQKSMFRCTLSGRFVFRSGCRECHGRMVFDFSFCNRRQYNRRRYCYGHCYRY
jgi:Right handed beta helix region